MVEFMVANAASSEDANVSIALVNEAIESGATRF